MWRYCIWLRIIADADFQSAVRVLMPTVLTVLCCSISFIRRMPVWYLKCCLLPDSRERSLKIVMDLDHSCLYVVHKRKSNKQTSKITGRKWSGKRNLHKRSSGDWKTKPDKNVTKNKIILFICTLKVLSEARIPKVIYCCIFDPCIKFLWCFIDNDYFPHKKRRNQIECMRTFLFCSAIPLSPQTVWKFEHFSFLGFWSILRFCHCHVPCPKRNSILILKITI